MDFFLISSESNGLIFVLYENKYSQSFFIVKVMYFLYLIFEAFISFLLVFFGGGKFGKLSNGYRTGKVSFHSNPKEVSK